MPRNDKAQAGASMHEMVTINALGLEPATPSDHAKKGPKAAFYDRKGQGQGSDLKAEFKDDLDRIKKSMDGGKRSATDWVTPQTGPTRQLMEILIEFQKQCIQRHDNSFEWPEAKGPEIKEVHGRVVQGSPELMHAMQMVATRQGPQVMMQGQQMRQPAPPPQQRQPPHAAAAQQQQQPQHQQQQMNAQQQQQMQQYQQFQQQQQQHQQQHGGMQPMMPQGQMMQGPGGQQMMFMMMPQGQHGGQHGGQQGYAPGANGQMMYDQQGGQGGYGAQGGWAQPPGNMMYGGCGGGQGYPGMQGGQGGWGQQYGGWQGQ